MTDSKRDNSYRSILKGASLFGGIQLFQIFIGMVRGKFVAMFLGPAGMGVNSLFTTTSDFIQRLASLGLNLAIVKEVAAVKEDEETLRKVAAIVRRMVLLTATAGGLICLLLAPWLSEFSFGNSDYAPWMMLLGAVVFMTILWQGEMSVLQGLHKVKILSKASLIGGLTGLAVGVPMYWLWGVKGVVPAMLAYALTMLLFYSISLRRCVGKDGGKILFNEHKPLIKSLLLMGVVLMASDLIGSGCNYMLNAFVRYTGDLDSVGLWQAANSLTGQYASVVFSAMALDYLPRLSAAVSDGSRFDDIVNRQTEIVSLLIAPCSALLITLAPVAVYILLEETFIPAIPLIRLMAFALILRGAMYPLGYVTFAKDNKRVFFWLEGVVCNIIMLIFNAIGFMLWGIDGIGIAMAADALLTLLIYIVVNRRLYGFRFSGRATRCILQSLLLGGAVLAASYIPTPWLSYTAMGAVTLIALLLAATAIRSILKK